jgi:hypothetical protein
MKKGLVAISAAVTLAAALAIASHTLTRAATPNTLAPSTTFPSLRTIYVGSGVVDSGEGPNVGRATSISCTNASGQFTNLRWLILDNTGVPTISTTTGLFHGNSLVVSTHLVLFLNDIALRPGYAIPDGSIIIESTQSGVFCTAMIVDAAATVPSGIPLHLVRVNPHPGTVE